MKTLCTNPKCTSGLPGLWEPIILLWPERPIFHMPVQPASVNVIEHRVCAVCVNRSQVLDFVPDLSHWMRIVKRFEECKAARPTLKTAKLTFMVPETAILGGQLA